MIGPTIVTIAYFQLEDVENSEVKPDMIFASIGEMAKYL